MMGRELLVGLAIGLALAAVVDTNRLVAVEPDLSLILIYFAIALFVVRS